MVPVNRNPNAPPGITHRQSPAASPAGSRSPSPTPERPRGSPTGNSTFADLPRPASRNAPIPNQHYVIDILPETSSQDTETGVSPRARSEAAGHDGNLPLPLTNHPSSRSVSFKEKLAASLKTGMAVSVPLAAINVVADSAGSTLLNTFRHVKNSPGGDLKTSLVAGGMGIAADVASKTLGAVAGHAYFDKKFYHDKNKSADEMIAAKKANSATLSYIGGTGSSTALSLAATALTGGAVTANLVKTTLISQVIGGLIVHPVVLGAAAGALAYQVRNGGGRAPDSLQTGLRNQAVWIQGKMAQAAPAPASVKPATAGNQATAVAPGDDMV